MVIPPPIKLSIEKHMVRLPTPFPGNSVGQAFGKPARGTIFLFLNQKLKYPSTPTPILSETQQKTSTKKTSVKKKSKPLFRI